jgi:SAM-dependent methyltransferase
MWLFSVSIMTHLDEPSQDPWLNEVHRVLAPGGLALITVHGEYSYDQTRNGHSAALTTDLLERLRLRGALHEEGFVFEPYELHRGSIEQFPGISGTYGLTFQHPARVARRWGERFEVLDHRVNAIDWWQDLVVLRKRSGAG